MVRSNVQQGQKIKNLEVHIQTLDKTIKDLENKNTTLGEENQHLKDTIAGLRIDVKKLEQELADEKTAHLKTQDKLNKKVAQYEELKNEKEALKKQLKSKKDSWNQAQNKVTNMAIETGAATIGGTLGSLAGPAGTAAGSAIGGAVGKVVTFVKDSKIGKDLADGWQETWKNIQRWWS